MTRIEAELWGAGGLAGSRLAPFTAGPGGGGGGAYAHTILAVTPGHVLNILVQPSFSGSVTSIGDDFSLALADAGTQGSDASDCTAPGRGGAVTTVALKPMIGRPGNPGKDGGFCSFAPGLTGEGGSAPLGHSTPPAGTGQGGGLNGPAGPGYLLIKW